MLRGIRFLAAGGMMAAALTLLNGCGDSREPAIATPVLGAVQLSSVTAVGSTTMVFTGTYQLQLSDATTGAAAKTNQVTPAGNVLTATATLSDVAPGQFLIDIVSNYDKANNIATTSTSKFLFKKYFVKSFGQGETVQEVVTIDATDTAKAYAYASWPKAKSKTITLFNPDAASLTALVATMTAHLKKSSGQVSSSFKWTPAIASLALELGKVTP